MKYDVKITGLGSMAMEFLDPAMEMQFVILFNDDAPPELADMAILHTAGTLSEDPAPGDTLKLGSKTYKITAVGDEAVHTLKEMGHCTLAFSSDTPVGCHLPFSFLRPCGRNNNLCILILDLPMLS